MPQSPQFKQAGLDSMPVDKALLAMRIIWGALLAGPILFLAVVVGLQSAGLSPKSPKPMPALAWISLGLLLTSVPVTFIIRRRCHQPLYGENGIRPAAYSTGNIIFWAGCEGVAFFSVIAAMLNNTLWPTGVVMAIALAFQVVTFPSGQNLSAPADGSA